MESAKDRNITFRLQGSGCLNINDVNIMKLINGEDHKTESGSIVDRIAATEESISDLKSREQSHMARITRLENG